MNNRIINKVAGFSLLIAGLLLLPVSINMIPIPKNQLIAVYLGFFGLITVYINLGSLHKGNILLGTGFFIIGIVLFINSEYEIFKPAALILPSVLFAGAAGFFLLFLDNVHNRVFLYCSVFFILNFFLFSVILRHSVITGFAGELNDLFQGYLAIPVILIGLNTLLKRKS